MKMCRYVFPLNKTSKWKKNIRRHIQNDGKNLFFWRKRYVQCKFGKFYIKAQTLTLKRLNTFFRTCWWQLFVCIWLVVDCLSFMNTKNNFSLRTMHISSTDQKICHATPLFCYLFLSQLNLIAYSNIINFSF